MSFLIILAITLAIDSFATCLSIGMSNHNTKKSRIIILIVCITLFHLIMPLIGYSISSISNINPEIGKYLTGTIFSILGLKMISDGVKPVKSTANNTQAKAISFSYLNIIIISTSLSIDALAAGFTIPLINLECSAITAAATFSLFAFILSIIGYYCGRLLEKITKVYSNIFAGALMLALALKAFLM